MKVWITRISNQIKRYLYGGLILISAAIIFLIFSQFNKPDIVTLSGFTMGTSFTIQLANVPADFDGQQLALDIQSKLDRLDKELMSTYSESSELSLFNQAAINQSFVVSPELLEVVFIAKQLYQESNHAFDITVGPLVALWGFGAETVEKLPPEPESIERAMSLLGNDDLIASLSESSLYKKNDIELDLSALAKGYGVDQISLLLEQQGLTDFLVEIGGELLIKGGKAEGESWTLGIEQPEGSMTQQVFETIYSKGERIAVAGSGDYRNYFELDGQRYSHEIDPTTGWPIEHDLVSVTVLAETAILADAWATAFMVMGLEAGLEIATRDHMPVYFIMRSNSGFESRYSDAFKKYLVN